jgi:hypothetical protein
MGSSARENLEYAKHAGWIDLAPSVRLSTQEYLQSALKRAPKVVEISPGHKIEILKDKNFDAAPFWFFSEPDDDDLLSKVQFYSVPDEEKALITIENILAVLC